MGRLGQRVAAGCSGSQALPSSASQPGPNSIRDGCRVKAVTERVVSLTVVLKIKQKSVIELRSGT